MEVDTGHVKPPAAKKPSRKPKKGLLEEAAEQGDVSAVLRYLERYESWAPEPPDCDRGFNYLKTAIEKVRQDTPQRLVKDALSRLVAFQTYLMIRYQTLVQRHIRKYDAENPGNCGNLPQPLTVDWLPRLSRIQREVKDSARALAVCMHVTGMGKGKVCKNADGQYDPVVGIGPIEEESHDE